MTGKNCAVQFSKWAEQIVKIVVYWNNILEGLEVGLNDHHNDVLQANTFKKWMKGLNIWISISVVSILIILIVIVSYGYKMGEKSKGDLLTLKTIVRTFEKEGIHLGKNNPKSFDAFELNGIKPAVFKINKTEDQLLIYTFKSFVEREDIVSGSNKFSNEYSIEEIPYNVKNAFIVYLPSKVPETENEITTFIKIRKSISDIIFKYLNDGKEIIFKGKSKSWEGIVTLKYYEHWWEDERGKNNYESNHTIHRGIKYKESGINDVGPIAYEYDTVGSSGSGTGILLDKNGYASLGSSGGNGMMVREKDVFNFTIKWNGKEEKLILKAQQ